MTVAIMQPYFFPYIGYWQLIGAVDKFIIYDDVNYIMRGWINRNRILDFGASKYITIPICSASPNKLICDTNIKPLVCWQDKLIRTIECTYGKAQYFDENFPFIKQLIYYESLNLSDYLTYQLQALSTYFGIQTEFILSSRHYENKALSGTNRVIDISRLESATRIINPHGGRGLYDKDIFLKHNIELKFLIPGDKTYRQFGCNYVPWLSIIDVIMFNSRTQIQTLLNDYQLE